MILAASPAMGLAALWSKLGTNRLLLHRLPIREEYALNGGWPALELASSAIQPDRDISPRHTRAGDNASIPLRWSNIPPGTQSLAVAIEDPDAPLPRPFVHWLVYNIPPTVNALPANMPARTIASTLAGVAQGKNSTLATGYTGPNPPQGDPSHHYHVQLFALDRTLPLPEGAGRGDVEYHMRNHVIAKTELVGTCAR